MVPKLEEGTGLGMVDGFIRQSGGHTSLRSEPGKGTTVQLLFPLSNAGIEVASGPHARRETSSNVLNLLIEDDPVISELIGTSLEEQGYRVLIAINAQAAEQAAAKHFGETDIIVSDVLLTGPNVVEKIGRLQNSIPTLFMSGHTLECWNRTYQFPKDSTLLQKSFKQERLFECIEQMIDNTRRDQSA
jgi:response regulator RpfG family c-di-GMP phosphodiesterase